MTLSEENKNKLLLDYGVYKYVNSDGKKLDYWCQNWIFIPKQYGDKIYMVDTFYFDLSSSSFELTNNNFNQFEFIFDKREVRKTDYYEAARYNEKDIFCNIAMDSGGYSCSSCMWVYKNASYDNDLLIKQAKLEVESAKGRLEYAIQYLKEMEEK